MAKNSNELANVARIHSSDLFVRVTSHRTARNDPSGTTADMLPGSSPMFT
jgi:hypothetical protein